jgi:HAD superfamily hydrolase (TIGR01549 family)
VRPITWVVFDVGETLVDETANWDRWADYLRVPRLTFHAVLGAVVAAGRPHTDVFGYFRPEFDLEAERELANATGRSWSLSSADLYADAVPTLAALRDQGYRLAVFANQPSTVEPFLATLPVDRAATSQSWGVEKPDPRFFAQVAEVLDCPPGQIAYVGDRVDNDIVPAKQAGLLAVHLRRGPWGYLHAEWPEADLADLRLGSLLELPGALAAR